MSWNSVPVRKPLRQIDNGLLSSLPPDQEGAPYDTRAVAYDKVVGSVLYNRLAWAASSDRYSAFCRQALEATDGPFLEAGSGSAVFTADAYVDAAVSGRPIVLVDRSLGMLEAARNRIAAANAGTVPPTIQFVQADILDLPFEAGSFGGLLSMGMLHLFTSIESVVDAFAQAVRPGGPVYLSGLVAETPFGSWYLRLLARAGEVAPPRGFLEMKAAVERGGGRTVESDRDGSMAYFIIHEKQ